MSRFPVRPVLLAIGFAVALASCASPGRPGADAKHELARGRSYAAALLAAGHAGAPLDDGGVIAVGYLERLRLGLGSPFRLADYAMHDPRLDVSARRLVGLAILQRTLAGDAYQPDAVALDRMAGRGTRPGLGRYHLELIEGAVAEARDPRAGELAVRLAYSLAAAEGSVGHRAPKLAAETAALLRDRAAARDDARRLLHAADSAHVDPLDLLAGWRADRRFEVERPRLGAVPLDVEREAMEMAPRLADAIRLLGPRLAGDSLPPTPRGRPLLNAATARRLATLADSADAPPETPVVVALRLSRRDLVRADGLSAAAKEERSRFVEDAVDEERFAALYALVLDDAAAADAGPSLARLAAATSLRTYAQEAVWFPGFGGPSTRELAERWGIDVQFSESVPAAWRPYYRRMIATALTDLQRVLPAATFHGLRIRVSPRADAERVLALHDPQRRILYLPPTTGAGTIAHELTHDLDLQVARRRYGVSGDYASDYAVRTHRSSLATRLAALSDAPLEAPTPGAGSAPSHAHRPTEVLARNMEWFVAVSLAAEGRMDGYLSSVQDDMLTGYGTVRPPDVTGAAGRALVSLLDEVSPLYSSTRDAFLRSYGTGRLMTPYDLVRSVLEAPITPPPATMRAAALTLVSPTDSAGLSGIPAKAALGFAAVEQARDAGFAAIDAWACAAPGAIYDRSIEAERRRLVVLAAQARARGIAAGLAAHAGGLEGWRWITRELYGGVAPRVPADSPLVKMLMPLVHGVESLDAPALPAAPDGFALPQPAETCDRGPLGVG